MIIKELLIGLIFFGGLWLLWTFPVATIASIGFIAWFTREHDYSAKDNKERLEKARLERLKRNAQKGSV